MNAFGPSRHEQRLWFDHPTSGLDIAAVVNDSEAQLYTDINLRQGLVYDELRSTVMGIGEACYAIDNERRRIERENLKHLDLDADNAHLYDRLTGRPHDTATLLDWFSRLSSDRLTQRKVTLEIATAWQINSIGSTTELDEVIEDLPALFHDAGISASMQPYNGDCQRRPTRVLRSTSGGTKLPGTNHPASGIFSLRTPVLDVVTRGGRPIDVFMQDAAYVDYSGIAAAEQQIITDFATVHTMEGIEKNTPAAVAASIAYKRVVYGDSDETVYRLNRQYLMVSRAERR